ncbi:putative MFS myo-inositol transporter, partial [Rhizodiscina lignyota]
FIWALTFSAGVSGLLFGYDTGVISSTLVSINTDLSNRLLTTLDKSLITSFTSLFALFASPTAGILADALGRKKLLLLADILFILGALWQAATSSVAGMIVGRSIVGAAVGAASFVAPLYISELAPSPFRGRLVTITVLFITFGQVIAYLIGWLLSSHTSGWRFMVGLGALPAVIQLLTMTVLPETPRWLVKADQKELARRVLMRVYAAKSGQGLSERQREALVEKILVGVEREIFEEEEARNIRRDPNNSKTGLSARLDYANHLFTELLGVGGNRRALIIACMLQGAQQLCGFNSLMYFSATVFALVGFRSPTLAALSVATTNFLFTLVAFYAIDRVGRRRILLLSVPIMTAGLGLCAIAFRFVNIKADPAEAMQEHRSDPTAWPIVVLVSMVIYVAGYATGLGNVPWQQSELFPLSVRSLGSSLATATNWASNTLIGLTFLPLMDSLTPSWTFTLYAGICAICWWAIWCIYPETAGLGLEDVGGLLKHGWGVSESLRVFHSKK